MKQRKNADTDVNAFLLNNSDLLRDLFYDRVLLAVVRAHVAWYRKGQQQAEEMKAGTA